ncbi:RNA pseudouridine synthase 7 [Dictyocoela muelleri]|nr:RNA pseudouridine synthase 7 [Dictyocoela muelleri]
MQYFKKFDVIAKGRWINSRLIDILETEYSSRTKNFYREAIQIGAITVNNKIIDENYIIKPNDHIQHLVHFHEPEPINIPIITIEDDLIVINKPAGIACHPVSGYQFYTVTEIMKSRLHSEFIKFKKEKIENRKIKNKKMINNEKMIENINNVKNIFLDDKNNNDENVNNSIYKDYDKNYDFKNIFLGKNIDDLTISCINRIDVPVSGIVILAINNAKQYHYQMMNRNVEKRYIALVKGYFKDIIVDKPLKKTGSLKTIVSDDGKPSKTIFKTIKSGDYSLIECIPVTGRSHQIRAHLSHIGFPIVGDKMYGYEKLINEPENKHEKCSGKISDCNYYEYDEDVIDFVIKNCYGTDNRAYRYQNYVICLHAYKYKIFGKEFIVDLPSWAQGFSSEELLFSNNNKFNMS